MHKLLFLAPVLLAACSTAPAGSTTSEAPANSADSTAPAAPAPPADSTAPTEPTQTSPVHGETPGHTCTTDGTAQFVGQTRSDSVEAAIKKASNAAVLRWAPPGVMLTMDYRADRVTVWLDASNKITQIKCG
jgi:hypothetical protein